MVYVPLTAHEPTAGFSAFRVDRLLDNSLTDFDLFVKVGGHFLLYSGNGYKWERSELEGLVRNGYQSLWIHPSAANKAVVYEKLNLLPQLARDLAPAKRILSIQDIGAAFTKYLYEGELTEACVHRADSLATQVIECIKEDPGCIREISGLANHDMYTYLHSIRVATYATAIAIKMGILDDHHLKIIAMGGIFHDIGKASVPLAIINKQGPLLDTEWAQMKSHPLQGFERTKDSLLNHVSREIIVHHHERLNGSGYPHGLDKNAILTEVQIATLADIFDALTSSRSYQNKRTRFEALDFIKNRLLRSDVSAEAFKGLIGCLAS
ncbi:MAG: HD domain-containing protein [Proteobacteria bacterium]|nr:HD domain-containing protein [Pseudomonadota bacterium]